MLKTTRRDFFLRFLITCIGIVILKELMSRSIFQGYYQDQTTLLTDAVVRQHTIFARVRRVITERKPRNFTFGENEDTYKDMMRRYFLTYDKYYKPLMTRAVLKRSGEVIEDTFEPRCTKRPFLLVLVSSKPIHVNKRLAIRLSWGKKDKNIDRNVTIVFALGHTSKNSIKMIVRQESFDYGDVLFNSDPDKTIPSETIKGFVWAWNRCPSVFVIKTNDDSYVNLFNVLTFLKTQPSAKRLYTGRLYWYGVDEKNKTTFFDPEFPMFRPQQPTLARVFTPYASESYIFAGYLLTKLLEASTLFETVPNDDAYIAILMKAINVNVKENKRVLPYKFCNETVWERNPCDFMFPLIMQNVYTYGQFWIHYHVVVLKNSKKMCVHSSNDKYKPTYCHAYDDILETEVDVKHKVR